MLKMKGSWRMTVDSCRFSQLVATITAGVPDVVSTLGQVNWTSGIWFATIDLANVFFTVP